VVYMSGSRPTCQGQGDMRTNPGHIQQTEKIRRAPTAPCIPPPTPRPGGFGGSQRSNGSPHGSPYTGGEMNLPPRMGGVSTLSISLITPFFHDINPV